MDHAGWGESGTQAMRMRSISSGIPHGRESAAKAARNEGSPPLAIRKQLPSGGKCAAQAADQTFLLTCGAGAERAAWVAGQQRVLT